MGFVCVCACGGATMGEQELEFSSMLDCMSEQRSVVHFPGDSCANNFPAGNGMVSTA